MRRLPVILSMISLIVLSAYIAPASAQGTATPRLAVEITVGDSRNAKFPGIATTGQTVNLGSGVSLTGGHDNTNAYVWSLAEQATSIGAGFSIGASVGKSDYSTTALGTAPDGSLYAVWSSINDRRISVRRRDATSGVWGPLRTLGNASGGFSIFPQIVEASNGQVFVIWQDVDKPLFMAVSSDQGASWSSTIATSEKAYSEPPTITVGSSGQVVVSYTTSNLNAAVAVWTGSGLSTEILSGAGTAADVTTSVGPDGKIYAAWRGLDSSGVNSGIYYAERQAANSWSKVQLTPGEVTGAVNVVVDSGGTVHLGWISSASGSQRFNYSFRPAGEVQFATAANTNVSGVFNSRMTLSSQGALAHASMENFTGSQPFITYARFSGGTAVAAVSAAPQIEADAAVIKLPSTVAVSFVNASGSPTQIRWRWGSAPTDTDSDSGGWLPYVSPLTITVPSTVTSAATCTSVRLYTQVRNASQVAGPAQFDDVVIDGGVTAAVTLANPHLAHMSSQFSDLAASLNDLSSDGGASDGDPAYTRDPLAYVEVQGLNECSGIDSIATARSVTSIAPSRKVTKNFFANVLPFPGAFTVGSNAVMLRVADSVGNTKDYSQTLTYDLTPPVLDANSPGSVSVTPDSKATILTTLTFSNIKVTDDVYPGGFWGVWIANSRTAVSNPATSAGLVWTPAAAPSNKTSFTIPSWSLATGLTADQLTPGSYTVYVRFIDGAGNPTDGFISATVNLNQVTMLKLALPVVRR